VAAIIATIAIAVVARTTVGRFSSHRRSTRCTKNATAGNSATICRACANAPSAGSLASHVRAPANENSARHAL